MFSFFKRQKIDIEQMKEWQKGEKDFFASGVLIHVKRGKGVLREVYINDDDKCCMTLMMGDQPLIQFQGDEYYCPTCEKIIRAGYGLEHKEWLKEMKAWKEEAAETLGQEVKQIYPLLNLLNEGYYVVIDTELYPTDGNGKFFWEPPDDLPATGSCVYYYGGCEWGNLRPYFTIASQPPEKCDRQRVEHYLSHPEEKAIAYYLDGYMTALLDGHHKTFAAALRHEKVKALVIVPMTCIYTEHNPEGRGLGFGDIRLQGANFNISDEEWKKVMADNPSLNEKDEKKEEKEEKKIAQHFSKIRSQADFPIAIEGLASYYPTASEVADIDRAGEIKEETLNDILIHQKVCTGEEAIILLKALTALKHPRTFEMGAFFSKQEYSAGELYEIIEELIWLPRTTQLEDFLIERLVALEEDYPDIGRLIMKHF